MTHTRTTTALLDGLIDGDDSDSWRELDERFRPILVAFAQRMGLGAEDAADAAQETFVRFVSSYREGKYDRGRGKLQSWMIGIAKHCIEDIRQRRASRRERRGISALDDCPTDDELVRIWDAECKHAMIRHGLRELRSETKTDPQTIKVFSLLAIEERSASDVALALGISKNDVYLAKHRCLAKLRQILLRLNEAYEAV